MPYRAGESPENRVKRDVHSGIMRWYPFEEGGSVLFIQADKEDDPYRECRDSVLEWLKNSGYKVTVIKEGEPPCGSYDYSCLIGILEVCNEPEILIKNISQSIKKEGRMLIAADNRFALRYFAGDHDPFTGQSFDGIEGYEWLKQNDRECLAGRSYALYEIRGMLAGAELDVAKVYAVFPDIRYAQLMYAEGYGPNEELAVRYEPLYEHPSSVYLNERALLNPLAENGMLHGMAGGYFLEVPINGDCTDICSVTLAMDRGEDAMVTLIRKRAYPGKISMPEGSYDPEYTVEKTAQGEGAKEKLDALQRNMEELKRRGVHTIPGIIAGGRYVMPYITAPDGLKYLTEAALRSREEFYLMLDRLKDAIFRSSEHGDSEEAVFEAEYDSEKNVRIHKPGVILKKGYVDMVPLNSFVSGGEFYFFDQEFAVRDYPANVILMRGISHVYSNGSRVKEAVPYQEVLERYGLAEEESSLLIAGERFLRKLRHKNELSGFKKEHGTEGISYKSNQQRISFSAEEYRRIFIDIFEGIDDKELILFGTGKYTLKFLSLFGKDVKVGMLLDNDSSKQGKDLNGIKIHSPEILKEMDPDKYKLIICIKQYAGVMRQVKRYGVKDIGVFDPDARGMSTAGFKERNTGLRK